jgi:hypothetical protein
MLLVVNVEEEELVDGHQVDGVGEGELPCHLPGLLAFFVPL